MRVVGIDPGMKNTGLAALELHRGRLPVLLGTRTVVDLSTGRTFDAINEFCHWHHPDEMAVLVFETSPRNVNGRPVFMKSSSLTQRTIGACEVFAHLTAIPTAYYDESEVKEGCGGHKSAPKAKVAAYVKVAMGWKTMPKGIDNHALDAVAVCLYHELASAMMRRFSV